MVLERMRSLMKRWQRMRKKLTMPSGSCAVARSFGSGALIASRPRYETKRKSLLAPNSSYQPSSPLPISSFALA